MEFSADVKTDSRLVVYIDVDDTLLREPACDRGSGACGADDA